MLEDLKARIRALEIVVNSLVQIAEKQTPRSGLHDVIADQYEDQPQDVRDCVLDLAPN